VSLWRAGGAHSSTLHDRRKALPSETVVAIFVERGGNREWGGNPARRGVGKPFKRKGERSTHLNSRQKQKTEEGERISSLLPFRVCTSTPLRAEKRTLGRAPGPPKGKGNLNGEGPEKGSRLAVPPQPKGITTVRSRKSRPKKMMGNQSRRSVKEDRGQSRKSSSKNSQLPLFENYWVRGKWGSVERCWGWERSWEGE